MAVRFAREGAQVGLLDRDVDTAREVAAALPAGAAVVAGVDLTVEAEVRKAVASVVDAFGGLDVAVVNAGVQLFGADAPVADLELEVWNRTVASNLTGAFLTAKHAIPQIVAAGGGSVIFTGSPTGLQGVAPGFTAYSASKAGMHGLVRVIAADYGRLGVRVNAVVPGYTETPLVRTISDDVEAARAQTAQLPLGRAGRPEDLEGIFVYLASSESAYATGGFFTVDGGMTAV